jgi:hypothetical protein
MIGAGSENDWRANARNIVALVPDSFVPGQESAADIAKI